MMPAMPGQAGKQRSDRVHNTFIIASLWWSHNNKKGWILSILSLSPPTHITVALSTKAVIFKYPLSAQVLRWCKIHVMVLV
jgi:hypothetical protein